MIFIYIYNHSWWFIFVTFVEFVSWFSDFSAGTLKATDPLDVCRTMADEEALKRLSRQQAPVKSSTARVQSTSWTAEDEQNVAVQLLHVTFDVCEI